jgi:hypothetical protein
MLMLAAAVLFVAAPAFADCYQGHNQTVMSPPSDGTSTTTQAPQTPIPTPPKG